jgi:hypothetical protein
LANKIEPLLHLKILDGDDGCLATPTMIEEDHKPFSFLLQQQTSEMAKQKSQNRLYLRGLGASHDFYDRQIVIFSKKSQFFQR